jgi:hypothetical protein
VQTNKANFKLSGEIYFTYFGNPQSAFDPLAVARINALIANNGLQATPDEPWTWTFAKWNKETPKQITELHLRWVSKDASFAGLSTLQTFSCMDCFTLKKIDLTSCTQLQVLNCSQSPKKSNNMYVGGLTELDLTDCTELKELYLFFNSLSKLDLRCCPQLKKIDCSYNRLTELSLAGLDNMTTFDANHQNVSLTLSKNEAGEYTRIISLNNPTFGNSAISYSTGTLKSSNNTVSSTSFSVQTGKQGYELSGTMNFTYSGVGISEQDKAGVMVFPNPTSGELRITNYELEIKNVEIFEINNKKHHLITSSSNHLINIAHLPAGIYFLKIATAAGEAVKKIIKQ